jgi:hypothetical protein
MKRWAALLLGLLLGGGAAFAAWDSTKPSQSQTVSVGLSATQANFAAIEAKTATIPGTLPSGAIFHMVTGSCPSWTTDVTATYSNMFIRTNATGGTTAGTNSHTHSAGSYAGPSHTHTGTTAGPSATVQVDDNSGGTDQQVGTQTHTHSFTTDAGGTGAVTGTSGTQNDVPVTYVTAKLCQVT